MLAVGRNVDVQHADEVVGPVVAPEPMKPHLGSFLIVARPRGAPRLFDEERVRLREGQCERGDVHPVHPRSVVCLQ